MPDKVIAIEEVLPQRGSMRLLESVESWRPEGIVARTRCEPGAWYADATGAMPAWIGIELMAQAIAAHVNLVSRAPGGAARRGVLLGTRSYTADSRRLCAGARLTVYADLVFRDQSGLGAYDCHIRDADGDLAKATVKVFEPDDFEQFVRSAS
jgi:predicted hotdog family 3-hydroxylacyl-ACP dehydratase